MGKLICVESYLKPDQSHYGSFLIEPLEIGQGITIGNAIVGASIDSIRIIHT